MIELLKQVEEIMKPHAVYAVGGCVRDYLLSIEPKDYDFCTPATPDEIEACIKAKGKRAYLVGKKFGTIGCKIDDEMIEITTFRSEEYEPGNRKPKVEYVKSINEDLSRRDFTINAMAIRLTKGNIRIIDPFCGQEDLEYRLIKCVGSPKQRFKEDPLRILRAIRFAGRFSFGIEEETWKKMEKMSIHILEISKERWMMELDKILMGNNVVLSLINLWQSNLFKYMIPELELQKDYDQNSQYHKHNLLCHTSLVVEATPQDINLRWAALLHDIAKPFVRTDKFIGIDGDKEHPELNSTSIKSNYIGHEILGAEMVDRIATHLKWSNERREAVVKLVRTHLNDDCPLRKYDNMGKK